MYRSKIDRHLETKINERLPIDAFLQIRMMYDKGYRKFKVVAKDRNYFRALIRVLEHQKCFYIKQGKVVYVEY